ncbi:unnamed protein product [Rhizophagus irregularis]|nr:unnamed protein product [Rhizophagus irregularis]
MDSRLSIMQISYIEISIAEIYCEKHPKAIYTSRSLNSYISKCSSINFSSNDYTSNDLEFDIDIKSELNVIGTKRNIEELNNNSCENNRKRIKIN